MWTGGDGSPQRRVSLLRENEHSERRQEPRMES